MSLTSWFFPRTASSEDNSWTNVDNIKLDDGLFASRTVGKQTISKYVTVTDFNLSSEVPEGSSFIAMYIGIKRYTSGTTLTDNYLEMAYDGGVWSDVNYAKVDNWPTSAPGTEMQYYIDLVGLPLQSRFLSPTFGFRLTGWNKGGGDATMYVDYIKIQVDYSIFAGPFRGLGGFSRRR